MQKGAQLATAAQPPQPRDTVLTHHCLVTVQQLGKVLVPRDCRTGTVLGSRGFERGEAEIVRGVPIGTSDDLKAPFAHHYVVEIRDVLSTSNNQMSQHNAAMESRQRRPRAETHY